MKLRSYQKDAVAWLTARKRAAVAAPAGSGKTIIAAAALSEVLKSRKRIYKVRIGWLCNTLEQKQQAQSALAMFPSIDEDAIVRIECAAAATDWTGYDVLVVDECHHAATAPQWQTQIATCNGALWGFTATPPEDHELNAAWMALFGGECHAVDRTVVGSNLASAHVILLPDTDGDLADIIDAATEKEFARRSRWWAGNPGQLRGQVAFQECIRTGIVGNKARTEAAVRTAVAHQADSVLMLVNQIEHGEAMQKQIAGSELCFSKMGSRSRKDAIEAFRAGALRCLIATSLADEGLDVPIANVLVLVSAGRSTARTEQRTGRVLRISEGKTHGLIYDFKDEWHPLAAKHSRRRCEIYRTLGYKIEGELHV